MRYAACAALLVAAGTAGADPSMPDRDPGNLRPEAKEALACIQDAMPDVWLVEGYRSPERQRWLYASGRTRPGPIVTWTLDSHHARGWAFDLAFRGGSPWDARHPWERLREVAATCGAVAPAWDAGDLGHYVAREGLQ